MKFWGKQDAKMHPVDRQGPVTSQTFKQLIGEDLSGITFVRDYLQFQFNPPPILNAYTPVTVSCEGESAVFGEPQFANLAIAQINKYVRSVEFESGSHLRLVFADDSTIEISLRASDYVGPEAVNLFGKNDELLVI